MHRIRVTPLTFLLCLSAVNCPAQGLLSTDALQSLGLEVRWNSQAVLNVRRDIVSYVTNDEEILYVQSSAGVLTAINAENGRRLWTAQIGRTDEATLAVVSNRDLVLVLAGPSIYGYNKFTGTQLLEFRLPEQPAAGPALTENAVFIPLHGGAVYAYSISVLEYLFRYGMLPDEVAIPHMWRFICAEEIVHPPVVGDQALTFVSEKGNVFTVNSGGIEKGRTRYQLMLNTPASAPLAIADNATSSSVVMLSDNNLAFSIDLITGKTEWTFPLGRPMTLGPIIVGESVYVVTEDGTLTNISRDEFGGRPVEIPQYRAPMYIGAGMQEVEIDAQVQADLNLAGSQGILVTEITPDSPATAAGLQKGDIITRIDEITVTTVEEAQSGIVELPLRVERPMEVIRGGTLENLKLKIGVKEWDVKGIRSLTSIGRFGVYGIDQANRLVGFNKQNSRMIGRLPVTEYQVHHHNSLTDQIYLLSKSGEILCLREIGPTVRMPELTAVSRLAKIVKVNVRVGDPVDPAGTTICEVELADGATQPITARIQGVIREIYIRAGQTVAVDAPLVRIDDDSFPVYHQRPEQQPVDVELNGDDTDGQ
ncbi:MAG: PQQ-binding-like beta-propeller repeat protein [Fuerstiella sp.]|nr:PQQ-binding-like beta-propeller repeat protein [Fuerstiella sp.]MCP4507902.1 PQQ-binding-like beta-propeller repeat protein [Fuerstiella sp.]